MREIIRYLIVGAATTVVSLLIYYALTWTILNPDNAIELQIANIIAWIGAVVFAFFTNRSFVFRIKDNNKGREWIKFVGSRVATLLIDMGLMFLLVTILKMDDKVIKIGVQLIVIILNYILSKFLVFMKPGTKSQDIKSDTGEI